MAKTKNLTPSIELRLSINLSLDDVGLELLYKELSAIETGASGLAPIQIHTLKRRHLLKILHLYCASGIELAPRNTDANSESLSQNSAVLDKVEVTRVNQQTTLPVVGMISQEHPPPMMNSAVEADQALLDSGFGFKKKT
jgi:hypothetical protein